jgi:hypothetical protein
MPLFPFYTYQVIPYNDSGEADGSNPSASATTPLLAPANLDAVVLSVGGGIGVVWQNQSSSETSFEVERSTDGTTCSDRRASWLSCLNRAGRCLQSLVVELCRCHRRGLILPSNFFFPTA